MQRKDVGVTSVDQRRSGGRFGPQSHDKFINVVATRLLVSARRLRGSTVNSVGHTKPDG